MGDLKSEALIEPQCGVRLDNCQRYRLVCAVGIFDQAIDDFRADPPALKWLVNDELRNEQLCRFNPCFQPSDIVTAKADYADARGLPLPGEAGGVGLAI